ncbi:MAG: sugar phosphate isomerase/epimerase [Fuerstiella sp.]|nr:sugar phosphate isomerase/epimerase [Fuerstiella sp.]
MKGLSCNSNILSEFPVEQAIDLLAGYGYDAIDICMEIAPPFVPVPVPHMSPDDDTTKRDRVSKRLQQAGIAIAALNAHTNLCARDPQERQINTNFVTGCLQLAADLGAPTVVTGAGGKNAYGYEQWYFDWAVDSLEQLLPVADRLGINLAIESGSPPGCLTYNIETTRRLLSVTGMESLRVLFDPAHYHIRGDNAVEAFQSLQDRIVHVHAKDATGNPENIVFPPLGQGEIDFDRLFGAMGSAGYGGYIAMEYEAFAWDFPKEPQQVLPQEKAFLDELVTAHWR